MDSSIYAVRSMVLPKAQIMAVGRCLEMSDVYSLPIQDVRSSSQHSTIYSIMFIFIMFMFIMFIYFFLSGADESIPKFVLGEMICGAQTVVAFSPRLHTFSVDRHCPKEPCHPISAAG